MPKAKMKVSLQTMTNGKVDGRAYRLGEDLAEAMLTTHDSQPGFPVLTEVKLRLFPDGSGLFEFKRGEEKFSLRFSEEGKPLQVYADFDGVEGVLMPDKEAV